MIYSSKYETASIKFAVAVPGRVYKVLRSKDMEVKISSFDLFCICIISFVSYINKKVFDMDL